MGDTVVLSLVGDVLGELLVTGAGLAVSILMEMDVVSTVFGQRDVCLYFQLTKVTSLNCFRRSMAAKTAAEPPRE